MTHESIDRRQKKILEMMSRFMEETGLEGYMILGYKDGLEFKTVKVGKPEMAMDMVKSMAFHLNETLDHFTVLPLPPEHE